MKEPSTLSSIDLRKALSLARDLGCCISRRRGTGDLKISHPMGQWFLRISDHRKDCQRILSSKLSQLRLETIQTSNSDQLKEDHVMKQQQKSTVAVNGNGHHKNRTNDPVTRRDSEPDMATEAELFLQIVSAIAGKGMETQKRELSDEIEALDQLVRGQEKLLAAVRERQAGNEKSAALHGTKVGDEFRQIHAEIEKRDGVVRDLDTRIGEMNTNFGKVVSAILERVDSTDANVAGFVDAQKDLIDRNVNNQDLIEQLRHATSEQQRQIVEVANDQNDLKKLVDQRLAKTERRLADLESLDQRFGRTELHLTELGDRTDRLQATLDKLAESLTAMSVLLEGESRRQWHGVISKALRFFRLA